MDVKFKDGVLKNKYPNDPSVEVGNNYLLMVALKEGRIEFLHFDPDSVQFRDKKVIGYFPYQYFINQLIKVHKRDFLEGLEVEAKLRMEKELLSKEVFKGWKHQQRMEPDFYLEKDAYHVTHEEPWENYWFESDYANIFFDFKPNRRL